MIHENHPNKAFFQLLNRWAQKPKQDFALDAFNTLVVVACNPEQRDRNLSHLLLQSRDFKIFPPVGKKNRERIKVSHAARKDQPDDEMSNAVERIDLTVRLLCSGLHTTHDIHFSHVRMNSVKRKHNFNLPSAIFLPPDPHGMGFDQENVVPLDKRNCKKTLIFQHKTHASKNVDFKMRSSKNVCFNPSNVDAPKFCNREKTTMDQTPTHALKSNSLDLSATICAPKRPLQNSPCNPSMAKKQQMFIDSSTKATEKSPKLVNSLPKTDEPETTPAHSFHARPLLGCHVPQCFQKRIWRNTRTLRSGFEAV